MLLSYWIIPLLCFSVMVNCDQKFSSETSNDRILHYLLSHVKNQRGESVDRSHRSNYGNQRVLNKDRTETNLQIKAERTPSKILRNLESAPFAPENGKHVQPGSENHNFGLGPERSHDTSDYSDHDSLIKKDYSSSGSIITKENHPKILIVDQHQKRMFLKRDDLLMKRGKGEHPSYDSSVNKDSSSETLGKINHFSPPSVIKEHQTDRKYQSIGSSDINEYSVNLRKGLLVDYDNQYPNQPLLGGSDNHDISDIANSNEMYSVSPPKEENHRTYEPQNDFLSSNQTKLHNGENRTEKGFFVSGSSTANDISYSNAPTSNAVLNAEDLLPINFRFTAKRGNIENEKKVDSLSLDVAGSGDDTNDEMNREELVRDRISGRLLSFFVDFNETTTPCKTPKDEPGHCRHFRHCVLPGVLDNFNVFLQYLCLVRGRFAGICCPDNPVTEIVNPNVNTSVDGNVTDAVKISLPLNGCGVNSRTRIVGGSVAKPREWTWMVALLRRKKFYCGGVIINNWYVLTAAHCTLGMSIRDITVRVGEYNFFDGNGSVKHDISVAEIKRHSQFTPLTFEHDITLLKLSRPVSFGESVGAICLPTEGNDFVDAEATVIGWGTVSFGGAMSPILRQVTVPVWRNEDCEKVYLLRHSNESFLCAGSSENVQDACQGDSGGPLMTLDEEDRWAVIGIVSWGRRCGDPTYPGVYTRVTSYLNWIKKNAV